jgi:hypothetical protein
MRTILFLCWNIFATERTFMLVKWTRMFLDLRRQRSYKMSSRSCITTKRVEQILPEDWETDNKNMHSLRLFHFYWHSLPLQFRSWLYAESRGSMNPWTIISTLARLVPGCWTRQAIQANKCSTFFHLEIHRSQTRARTRTRCRWRNKSKSGSTQHRTEHETHFLV